MTEQIDITLTVNSRQYELRVHPSDMLADVLRDQLKLTGTKIGCGEAECGSCTVLVDNAPVLACIYPAPRAAGRQVITIEGLSTEDGSRLHPIQDAFVSHGAVQCGFCIPGQIMTAYALLRENPNPDEHDIQHTLKDTLCRCGGYPSIVSAIRAAAESMNMGEPVLLPSVPLSSDPLYAVGQTHVRPDAVEKVTGTAKFTDDLTFDGMLCAGVKRAGIPHGILKSVDASRAQALPGVQAVLTAEDIPAERNHGLVIYDWPVLVGVDERIRYVGDAVAIVAADNPQILHEALSLIEITVEEIPIISDPVTSKLEDAPQLHESGNLLKHIKVRKGDVIQGFSEAELILEHTFHTPLTEHAFIEPECTVARVLPDGMIEVYVGSQIVYADRSQIARVLGLPEERVRVIGMMVGGGFGGKEDIAGQIHAAMLAQVTKKPIKILFDRHESLLVHPKRHGTQIRIKIGAKKDGTITAIESELYGDTGAYASLGEKVMTRATTHSSGPYDIPNARADCYAMYTNNPPAGAFRGFGVTQSCFAVESMIDMLSHKLGLDPIQLRYKNALEVGSVTNTGQVLRESVGLLECLKRTEECMQTYLKKDVGELKAKGVSEEIGWHADRLFAPRRLPDVPHRVRAWGLALAYKNTGLGGGAPDKAIAEVELTTKGILEVRISSAEIGQGLVTSLQLIVAEVFNHPVDKVSVLLSDTGLTPDGGPTTASRQTYMSGNAARYAASSLKEAIQSTLAEKYDQPPEQIRFIEGLAQVGKHSIPLGDTVAEMRAQGHEPIAIYEYWAPETQPLGQGGDMHFAFSFAVQAAEVEVDTHSGEVHVTRVIAANDVGKAINPLGLQGQVEGGVMMGLGNALTEEFIVEQGIVFTDRLARYRIPAIVDMPEITSIVVEHPTVDGPFGAKGVGEISSIPTTPAITNAIFNAVGVRVDSLPVDQELILEALKAAGNGSSTKEV